MQLRSQSRKCLDDLNTVASDGTEHPDLHIGVGDALESDSGDDFETVLERLETERRGQFRVAEETENILLPLFDFRYLFFWTAVHIGYVPQVLTGLVKRANNTTSGFLLSRVGSVRILCL